MVTSASVQNRQPLLLLFYHCGSHSMKVLIWARDISVMECLPSLCEVLDLSPSMANQINDHFNLASGGQQRLFQKPCPGRCVESSAPCVEKGDQPFRPALSSGIATQNASWSFLGPRMRGEVTPQGQTSGLQSCEN